MFAVFDCLVAAVAAVIEFVSDTALTAPRAAGLIFVVLALLAAYLAWPLPVRRRVP